MQLVEVRERVEEVEVVRPVQEAAPTEAEPAESPRLFDNLRKFELMAFGVPEEWVDDVRAATEDTLFDIITHLPQEAQEALLKLAVGERPEPPEPAPVEADPFAHPDAQRRFRVLTNIEELERALDYPWEKWAVFLHPEQVQFVERSYSGPARISGTAGTGKTVVALHRAVHLARVNADARILLTTFSKALANALKLKLRHLAGNEACGHAADHRAVDRRRRLRPSCQAVRPAQHRIARARAIASHRGRGQGRWAHVLRSLPVRRMGRSGRRLADRDLGGLRASVAARPQDADRRQAARSALVDLRASARGAERAQGGDLARRLRTPHGASHQTEKRPFAFAVVDEAQDIGVAEARFLAALASDRSDGLFFAGDLGQRIFQQPFSWKSLGIDVRGRSHTLRINYRTSHQIRAQADRLLPPALSDVDGNAESRRGTISVFNGPPPEIHVFDSSFEECEAVGRWVADRLNEGYQPHEIGVFVRASDQLKRVRAALKTAGAPTVELSEKIEAEAGKIAISTMHLAKGLEFRAVAVMACDDEVIPSQARIETVTDESDLEEVYNTERHLLYVACTRARDRLMISGVEPASEFLDDLPHPWSFLPHYITRYANIAHPECRQPPWPHT
jgi:hypothetical protein